ncbi:nucleotidyltransferase domain-containing protein [Candidatus Shapirobacteria bacterium]|nr:nucleotidyltransferase domain-containing protein [Candidatus Shapirobacteria bacterium]
MTKNELLPKYIQDVLEKIWEETSPVSIFLYGSMARGDSEVNSDYELGIIYKRDKKIPRSELAKYHNIKELRLYPFGLEDLANNIIDTPFPKAIYLRGLLEGTKLLYGRKLTEIFSPPKVKLSDLMEGVGFCLGRGYSAVVSSRQNDMVAVQENFSKSTLYGLQILLALTKKQLVFSYKVMYELSKESIPNEYLDLINNAIAVRKDINEIKIPMLYTNISFLNNVVLNKLKEELLSGDREWC